MLIRVSTACPQTDRPYITHWRDKRVEPDEVEGEEKGEVACSIVAMCSGSRKNKMPTSQQFRMLWCGAQNPPQVAPLQLFTSLRPLLCHPVLDSCNASKHFNQTACKKCPTKKGRTHSAERERVGVAGGAGCESMGQLNDAYKLPASALNAFVSVFLPRHELRFTHSHSLTLAHPALTLTLSYSLCLIRMQRRRAKSETVCQSEMTEKRRETTETSCSKEGREGEWKWGIGRNDREAATTWREKTQFDLIKTNFRLWAGKICAPFLR